MTSRKNFSLKEVNISSTIHVVYIWLSLLVQSLYVSISYEVGKENKTGVQM